MSRTKYRSLRFITCAIMFCLNLASCSNQEKTYYENGQLNFEVELKDGKREGQSKRYYKTGELYIVSNWNKGVKSGLSRTYYRNGQINSIENYLNGIGQGIFKYYDSLGNLEELISIKDGKKNGTYLKYHKSSQSLYIKGNYIDNKRNGNAIIFYYNDKIYERVIYEKDSLIYSTKYDPNGTIFSSHVPLQIKRKTESRYVHLDLELTRVFSEKNSTRLIVGHLDSIYNLIDTTAIINSNNHRLRYTFIPNSKPGDYKVEGLIHELHGDTLFSKMPLVYEYHVE